MAASNGTNKSGHRSFFPIKVRTLYPADLGADSEMCCRADDGLDYQIKDMVSGDANQTTPHSEWFCTRLAEAIGIACPPCAILEMHDGTLVFGSRWEGGVLPTPEIGEPSGLWWQKVRIGEIKLDDIKHILSRIYAFDSFINNIDRYNKNFIVRGSRNGLVVLANDYSRAWLRYGMPLPTPPMSCSCNTIEQQRLFSDYWKCRYIDGETSSELLKRIAAVEKPVVQNIINSHPESWLTPEQEKSILDWWGSELMLERIMEISRGIADGSYL